MTNNVRLLINELMAISNLREELLARPAHAVRLANGFGLAVVRLLDGAGISRGKEKQPCGGSSNFDTWLLLFDTSVDKGCQVFASWVGQICN